MMMFPPVLGTESYDCSVSVISVIRRQPPVIWQPSSPSVLDGLSPLNTRTDCQPQSINIQQVGFCHLGKRQRSRCLVGDDKNPLLGCCGDYDLVIIDDRET